MKAVASTLSAAKPQTQPPPLRRHSWINPEILGDKHQADFRDNEDTENEPCYTGHNDVKFEDDNCVDPDMVKEMETDKRATWLGKWFGHHYAPWVSEFDMKELEDYNQNNQMVRDTLIGPVPSLWWTFQRFQIPEDEWQSPSFHPPVQYCSTS